MLFFCLRAIPLWNHGFFRIAMDAVDGRKKNPPGGKVRRALLTAQGIGGRERRRLKLGGMSFVPISRPQLRKRFKRFLRPVLREIRRG